MDTAQIIQITLYFLLIVLMTATFILGGTILLNIFAIKSRGFLFRDLVNALTQLDPRYRTLLCGEGVHNRIKWLVPSDIVVISQFGVFAIKASPTSDGITCTVATYEHYPQEDSKPDKIEELDIDIVPVHINRHRSLVMGVKDVEALEDLLTGRIEALPQGV